MKAFLLKYRYGIAASAFVAMGIVAIFSFRDTQPVQPTPPHVVVQAPETREASAKPIPFVCVDGAPAPTYVKEQPGEKIEPYGVFGSPTDPQLRGYKTGWAVNIEDIELAAADIPLLGLDYRIPNNVLTMSQRHGKRGECIAKRYYNGVHQAYRERLGTDAAGVSFTIAVETDRVVLQFRKSLL